MWQELHRELGLLDTARRAETTAKYDQLEADGVFDATIESSQPKLAAALTLNAIGVHFMSEFKLPSR